LDRGTIFGLRSEYRNAINDWDRAVSIATRGGGSYDRGSGAQGTPASVIYSARLSKIYAYNSLSEYNRALSEVNMLLAEKKGDNNYYPFLLETRAHTYFGLKRYDEAIQDCDNAKSLHPWGGSCQELRGDIHFEMREYDRATLSYDELVKQRELAIQQVDANNIAVSIKSKTRMKLELAQALAKSCRAKTEGGWLKAATADCRRALELAPNDATVLFANGKCALAQGKKAEGDDFLKRAFKTDPTLAQTGSAAH
jgi:tetratricopeptide (TPR) repeat protein